MSVNASDSSSTVVIDVMELALVTIMMIWMVKVPTLGIYKTAHKVKRIEST